MNNWSHFLCMKKYSRNFSWLLDIDLIPSFVNLFLSDLLWFYLFVCTCDFDWPLGPSLLWVSLDKWPLYFHKLLLRFLSDRFQVEVLKGERICGFLILKGRAKLTCKGVTFYVSIYNERVFWGSLTSTPSQLVTIFTIELFAHLVDLKGYLYILKCAFSDY